MISKAILTLIVALAASAADADQLFSEHSILEVKVAAPWKQIMSERPEEDYVPGKFSFNAPDGTIHDLDVGIRTRGNFRHRSDICPFAPLRINFDKSELDDTMFDKQDKLKLVTHCRNGSDRYDQAVVSEYLAYRILNIMTDTSFRVRLMRMTYIYTDDDNDSIENYAFFVEHEERLAKRLELTQIELPKIGVRSLQPEYANMVSVFQFLAGNTDFSPIAGAPGEPCCHNHALFGLTEPPYWSVPYDFDQTGIASAPHATPNPRFGLRNVRQRLYRGRCSNTPILPDTLALFRNKRSEIETLIVNQPGLTKSTRKRILSYIEDFYDRIDNAKRIESQLVKACI